MNCFEAHVYTIPTAACRLWVLRFGQGNRVSKTQERGQTWKLAGPAFGRIQTFKTRPSHIMETKCQLSSLQVWERCARRQFAKGLHDRNEQPLLSVVTPSWKSISKKPTRGQRKGTRDPLEIHKTKTLRSWVLLQTSRIRPAMAGHWLGNRSLGVSRSCKELGK